MMEWLSIEVVVWLLALVRISSELSQPTNQPTLQFVTAISK